jgi:ligand-binding sensor domain-containing protein
MSKLKRIIPTAVLVIGIAATAGFARQADSVSFERPNEFRIIAASSPPTAFAIRGNDLWYATSDLLVHQPLTAGTRNHNRFPTMGTLTSTGITSILFDAQGRIWVAADGGVAVRAGTSWTVYTSENGLPAGSIQAMALGGGGDIWIGTENGAARFNGSTWTVFTTEQGLVSNRVRAITADSRGRVYIGTNRGLSVWTGSAFENFTHRNTGNNGLEWNNVGVLHKEPNSDIIWMTDGERSINSFNYDTKEWRRFMEIQSGITSIMNDTRRTWFGHGSGLLRFNGEEWVDKPDRHGVPVEQVNAMFRDQNGDLWFAMEKGILHLNNPYRR